jgi:hypothetical protein
MRAGSIPPRRSSFIPSGPHRQGSETVNLVAPGSNPGLGAITPELKPAARSPKPRRVGALPTGRASAVAAWSSPGPAKPLYLGSIPSGSSMVVVDLWRSRRVVTALRRVRFSSTTPARIAQQQCSRLVSGRPWVQILLRAPDRWRITAWSPGPALTRLVREFDSLVRCHEAGPLARAPAFEAGRIGAIPIPAANESHSATG